MTWRIELIFVPVTDVDRAKAFYTDRCGFNADYDVQVDEKVRFVQLTPPGSACSIALGTGISDMEPGTQRGIQVVIPDAAAARTQLLDRGVEASEVDVQPWGSFVTFSDPDGNRWTLQEMPRADEPVGSLVAGARPGPARPPGAALPVTRIARSG